ncbi:RNA-binding domain-containing protein, partial [Oenococcus oeni]
MLLNSKDQPFPAENQVIEYKEDFTDRIKREIAGFLNGKDRAFIYIGVSDKKREIVREFSIDEKHSF